MRIMNVKDKKKGIEKYKNNSRNSSKLKNSAYEIGYYSYTNHYRAS